MKRALALIFTLAALYGCPDDTPVEPGDDAGRIDAGVRTDAAQADARAMDATAEDAASEDAANEDAAPADAGDQDATAADAMPEDVGPRPCPNGYPRAIAAEMNVLPSMQAKMWRTEGNLGEQTAVTDNMDGTITIRDMYADTLLYQIYQGTGCPAAAGDEVTIEWRTNTIAASPDPYASVLLYVEPDRIIAVALHPSEVFFYNNPSGDPIGPAHAIAPGFHEFRLERRYPQNLEGTVELYVDNVLALTQTATSFPNVVSAGGTVTFGARGGFSTSEAIWDYVRYSVP